MKEVVHLYAYSENSPADAGTRSAQIAAYADCIVVDLSDASGLVNGPDSPRIYIEWRPATGWVVILHCNDADPVGRVFLKDDGTALFEED